MSPSVGHFSCSFFSVLFLMLNLLLLFYFILLFYFFIIIIIFLLFFLRGAVSAMKLMNTRIFFVKIMCIIDAFADAGL